MIILSATAIVSLCLCWWWFTPNNLYYDAVLDMWFTEHPYDERSTLQKLSRYERWKM